MKESFKRLNCFTKMIHSIMSRTRNSFHNQNQNQNDSKAQKKKKSRNLDKKITNNLSPTLDANSVIEQEQQNDDLQIKRTAKFASIKNPQTIGDQNSKKQKLNPQTIPQIINEVEPQTQRSLINKSINELSELSESDQNDLPTQKSDIIMNYIGKSVNYNQNIFMNRSQEDAAERFDNIYDKIKLIRSGGVYQVFEVKKKSTDAFYHAFVMKDIEVLSKRWGLSQSESIQKYTELYERQKTHIRNLTELQKQNCRHLAKLMDYELRPPTYHMTNSDREFSHGSIVIVFENVQQTLQEFLVNNSLDKSQKKKIVYQLVTCLGDVHKNKMGVRDLSLRNFYIDRCQNLKFISLQIEQFGCYSRLIYDEKSFEWEQNQDQQNLLYTPPQILPLNFHEPIRSQRRKDFHSEFSSNYGRNQPTEEQCNLWKLGVIIGKILTGMFILSQPTPEAQGKKIIQILTIEQGDLISTQFKSKLQGLTQGQIQIIRSLLTSDYNCRKSCKELLELKYLRNLMQEDQQI